MKLLTRRLIKRSGRWCTLAVTTLISFGCIFSSNAVYQDIGYSRAETSEYLAESLSGKIYVNEPLGFEFTYPNNYDTPTTLFSEENQFFLMLQRQEDVGESEAPYIKVSVLSNQEGRSLLDVRNQMMFLISEELPETEVAGQRAIAPPIFLAL